MDSNIFQKYLDELVEGYDLDEYEVLHIVEGTLAEVLTTRYPTENVLVHIDTDSQEVHIVGHSNLQGGHQRIIPLDKLSGMKNLQKHISIALDRAAIDKEKKRLARIYKNNVCLGQITKINSDGSWQVCISLSKTLTRMAICPVRYQTAKDKDLVSIDSIVHFYIRRVDALHGYKRSEIKIVLDRLSTRLVEGLLLNKVREKKPEIRIRCRNRWVGQYCEIWATDYIPQTIRAEVSKLLGERIRIFVGSNSIEIKEIRRKLTKAAKKKRSNTTNEAKQTAYA